MMGGFNIGFGSLGLIGMLLNFVVTVGVIGGIAVLIVWGVGRLSWGEPHQAGPAGPSAREILQARYARGELSREQYLQMLSGLG